MRRGLRVGHEPALALVGKHQRLNRRHISFYVMPQKFINKIEEVNNGIST